jgi:hypothetical protein
VWAGLLGMNNTRGSTPPNPTPDLPNCSTDLRKTLAIVGTPHGESIAKFNSTKTCQIKGNRRNHARSSSNPRTPKTPKSSPFTRGFGKGIQGKRTTKCLSYGPPWAHYLGGYQDRLLGRPLGLLGLCHTAPDGVRHKDYGGEVLG